MDNDELKCNAERYRREVRCPVHGCLIGRYDARTGLINTTFYCQKCKIEYTFTIKPIKNP